VTKEQNRPCFIGIATIEERLMEWITRERPKIDRIACPWLVLRFIDVQAQFHYVPADRVLARNTRLGARRY
jgi:hypothetical protein